MDAIRRFDKETQPVSIIKPILRFAAMLLKASLRSVKALVITLGMPLFMLFTIWVPTLAGDEESQELMLLLFPAIILLSVIMPGLTQTMRLTRWQEQRIYQRLALTPIPLSSLMVTAAFTQTLVGVGQGILMLLFGMLVVGLELTWQSMLLVLASMVLAGCAFIAFGSMIASFTRKADLAGYVFFFMIMPLTFLASFPPEMMPDSLNLIRPWLPTSMAIRLIGPLFLNNQLSSEALFAGVGLVMYTLFFAMIGVTRFQRRV